MRLLVNILTAGFLWPHSFVYASPIKPAKNQLAPRLHTYPVQKISVRGIKDIQIAGVKGHVHLRGRQSRSLALKVKHSAGKRFEDWLLSVDRRGDTLYLEVINLVHGKAWKKQVKQDEWPEFDIDLEGPSRPTNLSWREGELVFDQWSSSLEIGLLKGQIRVQGGEGPLTIQPMEAGVEISSRVGDLKIQGETGNLKLSEVRGVSQINWLKGRIEAVNCSGSVQIDSREGTVEVRGGQGKLSVNLTQGNAFLDDFRGTVIARGERTHWKVKARAPSDLNVLSQSGAVNVDWWGGARVFLTTTDGELLKDPPSYLKEREEDGHRAFSGTKRGKTRGEVFVRTRSGAISWSESDSP
jgi:hypothetical protein